MNKVVFGIIILVLYTAAGCKNHTEGADEKTNITVSVVPQKYIVKKIAGNEYDVNVMVPPGASPAVYEPSPRQLGQLNQSVAYLQLGHIVFEKAWMEKIKAATDGLRVINITDGLEMIEHEGSVDPHSWTSPEMVSHMAGNIADALSGINPDRKDTFQANLKNFRHEIRMMQDSIHQMLKPYQGEAFMIYHPALSYYCREFDLKQIPIEQEGKEPSASQMQQIIRTGRQHNIKAILIQKQFDQKSAKTIAKELDAEVISINPLAENWKQSVMDITINLVKAFKKGNHGTR